MQDVRHGVRILRREPAFALVAIVTIALGIGATTTLFSITYGVLGGLPPIRTIASASSRPPEQSGSARSAISASIVVTVLTGATIT